MFVSRTFLLCSTTNQILFSEEILQNGADVLREQFSFVGVQSVGIEAVAVMESQQFLECGAQVGEGVVGQNAFEPVGEGFAGLAGDAAGGEFGFQLIKFGIESGPEEGVGRIIAGLGRLTSSATAEDDLIE